ncbi:MAG: porin [Lunatimonas sp.]|uniref:porin n=1 Tax=Lunatimonas sp. TaxID=2060141 RepID=UPI00263ADEB2|nr:porin [Lunatimonas sp.]MCC5938539.1 porin [Lunatimonas sp.]
MLKRVFILIALLSALNFENIFAQGNPIDQLMTRFDTVNGIGFIPRDSSFSINLRFRMQSRFEGRASSDAPLSMSERSFLTRRARLHTFGHLLNNRFRYSFQLGFTRGDLDITAIGYPALIRDAVVFYRVNKNFELGAGVMKLPGNRQRVISSADLQFTSRSILNETFNIDRDNGFFGIYRNDLNGFRYNFIGALTVGTGRNFAVDRTTGVAYSGKLELLPFGNFTGNGDYFEGDYYRESTPKLSLAGSYNHTQDAIRTGGQIGMPLFGVTDMSTVLVDALFKYRGYAFYGEFAYRSAESPITSENGILRNVYTGNGYNLQSSYIFPSNVELAARFAGVSPGRDIQSVEGSANEAAAVVTKYFRFHRIKAQAEVTYRDLNGYRYRNDLPAGMIYRFQIEFGI